jgi:hypothetical protein
MTDPTVDPLDEARRERQRILDRVTWWDLHRYEALFPLAIALFAAGYGTGYALRTFFHAPERTEVILALGTLLVVGRLVDRHFSATHLDRIDAHIARLERGRKPVTAPTSGSPSAPR